jgi:hypothetical protein
MKVFLLSSKKELNSKEDCINGKFFYKVHKKIQQNKSFPTKFKKRYNKMKVFFVKFKKDIIK